MYFMKRHEHLIDALQSILLNYQRGYTCWFSLVVEPEKLPALSEKWAEKYGTKLAAYQRQDKKQKGLPTAVAIAGPVIASGKVEVIIMATEFATTIGVGPFSREKWSTRLPVFSKFNVVHETRERGDSSYTWRINEQDMNMMEKHLLGLLKEGDSAAVSSETHQWTKFYQMFGGVRRQMRSALKRGQKLWNAAHSPRPWSGPDPEKLPMMVGFKASKSSKSI